MKKFNKVVISVLAAVETLTLFPLVFFGIYTMAESGDIIHKSTYSLLTLFLVGIFYIASVLLGSFKAIQNFERPLKAYAFLVVPLITIAFVLLTSK